jgi:hypothetical protein
MALSAQAAQGLSMSELNDMSQHPDEHLVDNLKRHNFAAISDDRWSRFNQWGLYLGMRFCVMENKMNITVNKTLAEDKSVHDDYVSMTLQVEPYPYGAYYFLKEGPNGSPLIELLWLNGPAAASRAAYYAQFIGKPLNCNDPSTELIAKNLAELYEERTKADAARGYQTLEVPSARPPADPKEVERNALFEFDLIDRTIEQMRRFSTYKRDKGASERMFEKIVTAIDRDRQTLDIAAEVQNSHDLESFMEHEKSTSCGIPPGDCNEEMRVLESDQRTLARGIEQMRQFLIKQGKSVPAIVPPAPSTSSFTPQTPPSWVSQSMSNVGSWNMPSDDANKVISALGLISDGFKQGDRHLLSNGRETIEGLLNRYALNCSRTRDQTTCNVRAQLLHLNVQAEVAQMRVH